MIYGTACDKTNYQAYINDCDYDGVYIMLQHIFKDLTVKSRLACSLVLINDFVIGTESRGRFPGQSIRTHCRQKLSIAAMFSKIKAVLPRR